MKTKLITFLVVTLSTAAFFTQGLHAEEAKESHKTKIICEHTGSMYGNRITVQSAINALNRRINNAGDGIASVSGPSIGTYPSARGDDFRHLEVCLPLFLT